MIRKGPIPAWVYAEVFGMSKKQVNGIRAYHRSLKRGEDYPTAIWHMVNSVSDKKMRK